MKVIELLTKIANGEEVPDKIYYDGNDYKLVEYGETTKLYQCLSEPYELINIKTDRLNEKVEIIQEEPRNIEVCGSFFTRSEYNRLAGIKEDKKIEKIKILNCDNYIKKENYETILTMQEIALDIQTLRHKFDEIIDYLEEKE